MRTPIAPLPIVAFKSEKGREFILGDGEHDERYPGDLLWSDRWPIFYQGKQAGRIYRNLNYGKTAAGAPRWQASTREIYWRFATDAPSGPGKGIGYDVAAFDSAEECLVAWGRSADEILDYAEKK